MLSESLTFRLEGSEQDEGAVLFSDFRTFLESVSDCLHRVKTRVAGSAKVRHRIVNLRTGSAEITIDVVSPESAPMAGRDICNTFARTIKALESGSKLDQRLKPNDLKAFRKLAEPVLRGNERRVEVAGTSLTTRYVANIDQILGSGTRSKGTIKGRIEILNVHHRNQFTLYPPIGNHTIKCVFPEFLYEIVHAAVKQSVTVSGILTFRADSPYPERVRVESIELHPRDELLPTLESLRGSMPDATSGKTAIEFIEAIRDG